MFGLSKVVLLIFVAQFLGWQNVNKEKERGCIIPSDDLLVVIASQPNCPIEVVNAYWVGFIGGGGLGFYQLRNRATKPIKSYAIAIIGSDGGVTKYSSEASHPDYYFLPGETTPSSLEERNFDIVPITDQLREKIGLNGRMKAIKIFMVVQVEFGDGSKYDATSEYESLKTFFEKNPISVEKEDKHKKR